VRRFDPLAGEALEGAVAEEKKRPVRDSLISL
jgi:hypothetical protein